MRTKTKIRVALGFIVASIVTPALFLMLSGALGMSHQSSITGGSTVSMILMVGAGIFVAMLSHVSPRDTEDYSISIKGKFSTPDAVFSMKKPITLRLIKYDGLAILLCEEIGKAAMVDPEAEEESLVKDFVVGLAMQWMMTGEMLKSESSHVKGNQNAQKMHEVLSQYFETSSTVS